MILRSQFVSPEQLLFYLTQLLIKIYKAVISDLVPYFSFSCLCPCVMPASVFLDLLGVSTLQWLESFCGKSREFRRSLNFVILWYQSSGHRNPLNPIYYSEFYETLFTWLSSYFTLNLWVYKICPWRIMYTCKYTCRRFIKMSWWPCTRSIWNDTTKKKKVLGVPVPSYTCLYFEILSFVPCYVKKLIKLSKYDQNASTIAS